MLDRLLDVEDEHVLFTARKSLCVFDALQRVGALPPNPLFSSTRILDGNCSHLTGRRVLVIEDIASSGRTLARTLEAVARFEPSEIEAWVLSIEDKPINYTQLVAKRLPHVSFRIGLRSTKSENLKHAQAIISALMALPRPYNIDWPLYYSQEPIEQWDLSRVACKTYGDDTPGPYNLRPVVDYAKILESVIPGWHQHVRPIFQLSKIRVYPVSSADRGGTTAFLTPIAAPGSVSLNELSDLLSLMNGALGPLLDDGATPTEQYRVLQYVLSDLLLNSALGSALPLEVDHDRALQYLFAPQHHERLAAALVEARSRAQSSSLLRGPSATSYGRLTSYSNLRVSRLQKASTQHLATSLLRSEMYERYRQSDEFSIREEIRNSKDSKQAGDAFERLLSLDRHDDGTALDARDMVDLLAVVGAETSGDVPFELRADVLVSEYLDGAIDHGVAVPELIYNGAMIGRTFRPGEIIEFEGEFEALLEAMLRAFYGASGGRLSGDMVQKLTIGFARYLLSRNLIEDRRVLDGSRSEATLLQFQYHIRGVTLGERTGDFVSRPGDPASQIMLERRGVITRDAPGQGFVVAARPVLEPPARGALDAFIYGDTIAGLLQRDRPASDQSGRKRLLTRDEYALLVTLNSHLEAVLALGADIAVATRQLRAHRAPHEMAAHKLDVARQAVSKGLDKAAWTLGGRQRKALQAITRQVEATGDQRQLLEWKSIAASMAPGRQEAKLTRLAQEQAAWLLDARAYFDCLSERFAVGRGDRVSAAPEPNRESGPLYGDKPVARSRRTQARRLSELDQASDDAAAALVQVGQELESWADTLLQQCYLEEGKATGTGRRSKQVENALIVVGTLQWNRDDLDRVLGNHDVVQRAVLTRGRPNRLDTPVPVVASLASNISTVTLDSVLRSLEASAGGIRTVVLMHLPMHLRPVIDGKEAILPIATEHLLEELLEAIPFRSAIASWSGSRSSPSFRVEHAAEVEFQSQIWRAAAIDRPQETLPFTDVDVEGAGRSTIATNVSGHPPVGRTPRIGGVHVHEEGSAGSPAEVSGRVPT